MQYNGCTLYIRGEELIVVTPCGDKLKQNLGERDFEFLEMGDASGYVRIGAPSGTVKKIYVDETRKHKFSLLIL